MKKVSLKKGWKRLGCLFLAVMVAVMVLVPAGQTRAEETGNEYTDFSQNIGRLEVLATQYLTEHPAEDTQYYAVSKEKWLTFMYIRQFYDNQIDESMFPGGANYIEQFFGNAILSVVTPIMWNCLGGPVDKDFVQYVAEQAPDLEQYFAMTPTVGNVDVKRFAQAMSSQLYQITSVSLSRKLYDQIISEPMVIQAVSVLIEQMQPGMGKYTQLILSNLPNMITFPSLASEFMSEEDFNVLSGWGGNFQVFAISLLTDRDFLSCSTVEECQQYAYEKMGKSMYPETALNGTIDAVLIAQRLGKSTAASAVADYYLVQTPADRYTNFLNKTNVRNTVAVYAAPYHNYPFLEQLQIFGQSIDSNQPWPLYLVTGVSQGNLTAIRQQGIAAGFIQYLERLPEETTTEETTEATTAETTSEEVTESTTEETSSETTSETVTESTTEETSSETTSEAVTESTTEETSSETTSETTSETVTENTTAETTSETMISPTSGNDGNLSNESTSQELTTSNRETSTEQGSTTETTSQTGSTSTTETTSQAGSTSTTETTSQAGSTSTTETTSQAGSTSTTETTSQAGSTSTTETTSQAGSTSTTETTSQAGSTSTTETTSQVGSTSTTEVTTQRGTSSATETTSSMETASSTDTTKATESSKESTTTESASSETVTSETGAIVLPSTETTTEKESEAVGEIKTTTAHSAIEETTRAAVFITDQLETKDELVTKATEPGTAETETTTRSGINFSSGMQSHSNSNGGAGSVLGKTERETSTQASKTGSVSATRAYSASNSVKTSTASSTVKTGDATKPIVICVIILIAISYICINLAEKYKSEN